jgi:protoheme IX farnesyltransferase
MTPLRTLHIDRVKLRAYWALTKPLQTGLLLITGLAGFMSARCPALNWQMFLGLTGSLFLAISGSTMLNMVYDRDVDAKMKRSAGRPLPSGRVAASEALLVGLVLAWLGVGWAAALSPLYGAVVFAGLFFDVIVYTVWLKRRTPWSIIVGGIAGGMPILAGRVFGAGRIDWVGLALALGVLLWIPTHIMTFNMRYCEDYRRAGVPTFPSTYGIQVTCVTIALSSLAAALAIAVASIGISMTIGYLRLLAVLSVGLLALAIRSVLRPSERLNFGLFKYASLYLLSSMVLVIVETV